MASSARLPSLTSLRFLLALWVIVFHQSYPWGFGIFGRDHLLDFPPATPLAIWHILNTGYVAVSVFFILSGFILAYNYSLLETWTVAQFVRYLVARVARIYPVYCLGLFAMAPFMLYLLFKFHNIQGLKQALQDLLINLALVQSWHPLKATSWNFPAWSLSDEAFFYCLFPWVGVLIWRLSIPRSIAAALLLWTAAMIAPLAAGQHAKTDGFWSPLVQYNPLLRLPDFCIGIALGRIYSEIVGQKRWLAGRGYYLYGLGIILEVFALSYGYALPHLYLMNGLFTPIHSLVILGLALGGGPLVSLLSARPLIFLGNASYAMYILQVPVFLWINYVAYRFFSARLGGLMDLLLYVAILCGVSGIVFQFFEQPANRYLRRRLTWASAPWQATGAIAAEPAAQTALS